MKLPTINKTFDREHNSVKQLCTNLNTACNPIEEAESLERQQSRET